MRFWATLLTLLLTYNISFAQNFFEKPPSFNIFSIKENQESFSIKLLDQNKFCVLLIDKKTPDFGFPRFIGISKADFEKLINQKAESKDEILVYKNKNGNLTTVSVKGKKEAEIYKFYRELFGDNTPKKAVVETDKLVVVSTSWCFWCRKLEKEVLPSLRGVVKIDEVDNENTLRPYSVNSYPTIIYFKNDKEVWRSGYLTAEQIKAKIGFSVSSLKIDDKEYHTHKCSQGHEWSHSHLSAKNIADHLCPECGELVWKIHETSKKITKG